MSQLIIIPIFSTQKTRIMNKLIRRQSVVFDVSVKQNVVFAPSQYLSHKSFNIISRYSRLLQYLW